MDFLDLGGEFKNDGRGELRGVQTPLNKWIVQTSSPRNYKFTLNTNICQDAKLFELFEEADMASNRTCPTPEIPLQPLLSPINDGILF